MRRTRSRRAVLVVCTTTADHHAALQYTCAAQIAQPRHAALSTCALNAVNTQPRTRNTNATILRDGGLWLDQPRSRGGCCCCCCCPQTAACRTKHTAPVPGTQRLRCCCCGQQRCVWRRLLGRKLGGSAPFKLPPFTPPAFYPCTSTVARLAALHHLSSLHDSSTGKLGHCAELEEA